MDAAQVERAVILGWYWENQKTCDILNAATARAIAPYADRLSAFCAINPQAENLVENLTYARDMGFVGIGELNSSVQNFRSDSENFAQLCEMSAAYNMPLSIHLSDSNGKDYPNKILTDNGAIYKAASAFPKTKFILAHWGGGEVFKEGFVAPKNIFYDTAANSLLYGKDAWQKINGRLAEQMIYGSDYPLRLYPRIAKEEEMLNFVNEARENVPSHHQEKFFAQNFCKCF